MKITPPPNNPQTEIDILHLCLYEPSTIPQITTLVTVNDFYNSSNKQNFLTILEDYQKEGFVDFRKITGLSGYLEENFVSPAWAKKLCQELKELSKKRTLLAMAKNIEFGIEDGATADLINESMNALTAISNPEESLKTDVQSISKKVLQHWEETKDKTLLGAPTGIKELDNLSGGFQKGHIWIVGGYTNYGKTTLAISFLANLIKETSRPLLFCSMEMSQNQIFEKIVSNFTEQTPQWNREHQALGVVTSAIEEIASSKLEITEHLTTVEGVNFKIKEMILTGRKPEVVFIDFIQNIQGKGKSEYERITSAIVELQRVARATETCLVVLSQVNNQSTAIGEVMGFKSSGALAAAGDITIQIVRDRAKEIAAAKDGTQTDFVEMGLVIQKNRHGRGGYIPLEFNVTKGLIVNH